jgi:hypothetical protein
LVSGNLNISRLLKSKAPFLLAVAVAFFVFLLFILANSIPALHYITVTATKLISSGLLWPYMWLASEFVGEVGLIIRFSGICFFIAFTIKLLWKKTLSWSLLRKSALSEGIYYILNLPFIIFLFAGLRQIAANFGAAVSYTAQMLLVTPIFLTLYVKLKKQSVEPLEVVRWVALAVIGFIFALWAKHFALALYALPFNQQDTLLVIGFLNSALTLLMAGVLMIIAFTPLLRKKTANFNAKLFGAALVLAGLYVAILIFVSLVNADYMRWINLVDLWIIALPILGVGLLKK